MNTHKEGSAQAAQDGEYRDLVAEQNKALERLTRPYVVVDVYPRRYVNVMYYRIRNVGQTPAFAIRMSTDPPIPISSRLSTDLNIFQHPIPALGKGEEISFFLGSAVELFNKEDAVLHFQVTLEYTDAEGTVYGAEQQIDLDLLRGLSLELPVEDTIAEKLDRIERDLERVARYADDLRHRALFEEHRRHREEGQAADNVIEESTGENLPDEPND